MARNKALTDLGDLDLYEQLSDAKEELFNLRFQLLTGQLENHSRLGQVKKEVPIQTELRTREIALLKQLTTMRRLLTNGR